MKIIFEDKSFIDIQKQDDKIVIMIQAKDNENHLKRLTTCVELTQEQYKQLIGDV